MWSGKVFLRIRYSKRNPKKIKEQTMKISFQAETTTNVKVSRKKSVIF